MKRKMLVLTALAVAIMLAFSVYGQAETQYELEVINKSGMTQTIAVYQTYPDVTQHGFPLVWFSRVTPNSVFIEFLWTVDWSLGWGILSPNTPPCGEYYTIGQMIPVSSGDPSGINEVTLAYIGTYPHGTYEFINKKYDPTLPASNLEIRTDATVPASNKIALGLGMSGRPVFVMPALPNTMTLLTTHPTYYLCITNCAVGTVVNVANVMSPTKVVFDSPGKLCYELNDLYQFVQIPCE